MATDKKNDAAAKVAADAQAKAKADAEKEAADAEIKADAPAKAAADKAAADAQAKPQQYRLLSPVNFSGKIEPLGAVVSLDDLSARELLAVRAVEPFSE